MELPPVVMVVYYRGLFWDAMGLCVCVCVCVRERERERCGQAHFDSPFLGFILRCVVVRIS